MLILLVKFFFFSFQPDIAVYNKEQKRFYWLPCNYKTILKAKLYFRAGFACKWGSFSGSCCDFKLIHQFVSSFVTAALSVSGTETLVYATDRSDQLQTTDSTRWLSHVMLCQQIKEVAQLNSDGKCVHTPRAVCVHTLWFVLQCKHCSPGEIHNISVCSLNFS